MVDQNGEPQIHAGCFYPSNPDRGMIWTADDCARFCNDDPNCKGFSIDLLSFYLIFDGFGKEFNRFPKEFERIW